MWGGGVVSVEYTIELEQANAHEYDTARNELKDSLHNVQFLSHSYSFSLVCKTSRLWERSSGSFVCSATSGSEYENILISFQRDFNEAVVVLRISERALSTMKQAMLKGRTSLSERKSECKYLLLCGKAQKERSIVRKCWNW